MTLPSLTAQYYTENWTVYILSQEISKISESTVLFKCLCAKTIIMWFWLLSYGCSIVIWISFSSYPFSFPPLPCSSFLLPEVSEPAAAVVWVCISRPSCPWAERTCRGFTCGVVADRHSRSLLESHPGLKIALWLRRGRSWRGLQWERNRNFRVIFIPCVSLLYPRCLSLNLLVYFYLGVPSLASKLEL